MTGRPFLTARWRNLLMVNYAVDPTLLVPYVPAGTHLDTHDGSTYLSLVAFQFLETSVMGVQVPLHTNFEELNLRFYVRREVDGEVRRAVVFIKEIVPRPLIALVARLLYNEPYDSHPMRHRVSGTPATLEYQWRIFGHWRTLRATALGRGAVPQLGSLEHFITEHYWGYTRQRDGGTLEYKVEHRPWAVWRGRIDAMPDLNGLYGGPIAAALTKPASVFVADGSAVSVYRGNRVA
jgi:uncharacterized protein YqjF (DUF2071 family)